MLPALKRLLPLSILLTVTVAGCTKEQSEEDLARDLAARFELAAVPGVTIEQAQGTRLAGSRVCAGKEMKCADPEQRYDINWQSAPEPLFAFQLHPDEMAGAEVLLRTEKGDPLLLQRGKTLVITADTSGIFRRWPYFNYLLYCAANDVAGTKADRFADWKNTPMPGKSVRHFFLGGLIACWALILFVFKIARRRGRVRPDAVKEFFTAAERSGRPANSNADIPESVTGNWSRTGFARPLAGLLTILSTMAFITGAFLALQWVLSKKVQPFPEADGMWRTTFEALWVIYYIFDMGTQTAFVKYFAEHRVRQPMEALKDVQFYVWWQFFMRLIQGTALCATAIGWLPYSNFAIYAPFVALYSLTHLPAMSGFGKLLCQALQRFDYQNLLDLAELRVLVYFIPIGFVLLGRQWGMDHPIYGEAFGAALGLGVGQLATQLVMVGIGLFVLKRMKLPLGPLFLAQFDWQTAKRQLIYGFKVTLGQEPIKIITALEYGIIVYYMSDFTLWQGIRDLLSARLNMLYFFAWMYYMGGISAFSEAFAAGKRILAKYYIARFFQFGFLFSATIFSLMCAVGPSFIAALGPEWARAAPFLVFCMAGGLLLPPAWVSDALEMGSGRPGIFTIVIAVEQVTRLALFVLLVPHLGFWGILIGTNGALALKALVAWIINQKTIIKAEVSWWTMLVAPGAAGLVNFAIWKGIAVLWAPTSEVSTLILFCVASAGTFFITMFVCGLAGGYDKAAQLELAQAARMTASFIRPMARALSNVALRGAKLAPFNPKPLPFIEEALAEARAIDQAAADALRAGALPEPPVRAAV